MTERLMPRSGRSRSLSAASSRTGWSKTRRPARASLTPPSDKPKLSEIETEVAQVEFTYAMIASSVFYLARAFRPDVDHVLLAVRGNMGQMLRLHNGLPSQCCHAASAWLVVTKSSSNTASSLNL